MYLAKFHLSETNIASRLKALINAPKSFRPIEPDKALQWVQGQLDITLAAKQVEAVKRAVTDKVSVITGGPGTGKTTIIKVILNIPKATFILVVNVNQLPSVSAGNVLHDIITSGAVPIMELNEIFRQARESLIIVNAHKINQGQMPAFKPYGRKLADF
jgi:ATP-dependent exoDNAse (exonuclease V) alpha subunit